MLKGYKQVIVALISILGGLATAFGYGIPEDTLTALSDNLVQLVGGTIAVYGAVMLILRKVTDGPMFGGKSWGQVIGDVLRALVEIVAKRGGGVGALLFAFALLNLAGCVGGAYVKPENPAQAAIYAQKLADSAEAWSTQMVNERLIHSSKGRQVQAAAREAREAAVLTRKIYAANPTMPHDALSALQAADQALRFLEQFLTDHGKPLPPREAVPDPVLTPAQ